MPIPQEKLDAWIAELRKPENKQATDVLARMQGDGTLAYCCLGLFCEKVEGLVPLIDGRMVLFDGACKVLPSSITARYQILPNARLDPDLHDREETLLALSALNDEGLTFSQIADLLEHFDLETN